jgi:hypothetical protein
MSSRLQLHGRLHATLAAFAASPQWHYLRLPPLPEPERLLLGRLAAQLRLRVDPSMSVLHKADGPHNRSHAEGNAMLLEVMDAFGPRQLATLLAEPVVHRVGREAAAMQGARNVSLLVHACAASNRIAPMIDVLESPELRLHAYSHNRALAESMAALTRNGEPLAAIELYEAHVGDHAG